jgi:hypothetical protein
MVIGALLVVAVFIWWMPRERKDAPSDESPVSAEDVSIAPPAPSAIERPALAAVVPKAVEGAPPFFIGFGAPERRPAEDNRAVLQTLNAYREQFGAFPAGEENRHIVNALAGANPRGVAFLDRAKAPLNEKGELIDRWGSPFFFHLIDRDWIEIRSLGKDRVIFTQDDIVTASRREPEAGAR